MKKVMKIIAAFAAIGCAALLLKLAAEVLSSCSHKYFSVDDCG